MLQRLGIEPELQYGTAAGILDILHLPGHEADMLFVAKLLSDKEPVLFQARNRPFRYASLEDLSDLIIGVSPGYWYSDEAVRPPAVNQPTG